MMLEINKSRPAESEDSGQYRLPDPGQSGAELFSGAVALVVRQYPVIIFATAILLALGLVYVLSTPPSYTAQATMLIDTKKVQIFQQPILSDMGLDTAAVESQVEVLKSENIALNVVKDLHLTEDQEFVRSSDNAVLVVLNLVRGVIDFGPPKSDLELTSAAVTAFRNRLTIRRVGLTYVIEIGFRSLNPDRAAQIANAVVDAYVIDQLEAKFQSTKRAGTWLQARLTELHEQVSVAERAVVEYKTQNNIVETGGRSMGEQQLTEINSQLVLARAQTAEASARLDRIQQVIRSANPDSTVSDALRTPVITRMYQQLGDISKREAEWAARYGPDHLAVVNLRSEMREIRRSILEELGRIAETYKGEFQIAKSRENAIKQSLAEAITVSQTTSEAQVMLRELESNAKSYRTLYDNFMQRHMESIQQQSFPISDTRLITRASRPTSSSHPKTALILGVSLLAGFMSGLGIAMLREQMDRTVRTTDQMEDLWGIECLAILPLVTERAANEPSVEPAAKKKKHANAIGPRMIARTQNIFWQVIDEPFSRYAEGVRSIKVALDLAALSRKINVIGVTSALPNEGKSTVATNLAQHIAKNGKRVILVDCDLRNPSLSRSLVPSASSGMIEVLSGKLGLSDVLWTDPTTLLDFLPTVIRARFAHTNEIMASEGMAKILADLRSHYDYVIVDFPPLAPVVDVRSGAGLVDTFLFVVEWGATKVDVVTHSLRKSQAIQERMLGMVLNKVNIATLSRFETHRGSYYSNKYYSRYGYGD